MPAETEPPKFPVFPNSVSVENDASLAKLSASVGHEVKRRVENYSSIDVLIKKGIDQFVIMLKMTLIKLYEYFIFTI